MRRIIKPCDLTSVITPSTNEQTSAWLRGLLTIAWADGNFDVEEQELIAALTLKGDDNTSLNAIEPITSAELAAAFTSNDRTAAENFLPYLVLFYPS